MTSLGRWPAWPRKRLYPAAGAVLSLGAPLGLLLVRSVLGGALPAPSWILEQWRAEPITYGYLTFATLAVFIVLGRILGEKDDVLEQSSITDPLTGLFNRRHIHTCLKRELARWSRHGTAVSVLLIDVDRLKEINDRSGHEAGDRALDAVARSLRGVLRATDLAGRHGGDEFVVVAPETEVRQAAVLAERIREKLREICHESGSIGVSISVGVADAKGAESPRVEALFEAADEALYKAKQNGRDQVAIASARRAPAQATPARGTDEEALAG